MDLTELVCGCTNFAFLGEAGCGKSEIAVNLACCLARAGEKPVHLFDLDMTKPLFRTRDLQAQLEEAGVYLHYEQQFMDAPTVAGGVLQLLKDANSYVILDVGGDSIGARSIGGYAPLLNRPDTRLYYVLNCYRSWSADVEHIDKVLGETLGVSHLPLQNIHLLDNANLGIATTAQELLDGCRMLEESVGVYKPIEFHFVWEALYEKVKAEHPGRLLPLHLYLTYPWQQNEVSQLRAE